MPIGEGLEFESIGICGRGCDVAIAFNSAGGGFIPEYTLTGIRSGSVISCGLGAPESPCVRPTVMSSSYFREILQVLKDGGTVSGTRTFSHSQGGTTNATCASSFELPIGTVMFDLVVSIVLVVSTRSRP